MYWFLSDIGLRHKRVKQDNLCIIITDSIIPFGLKLYEDNASLAYYCLQFLHK